MESGNSTRATLLILGGGLLIGLTIGAVVFFGLPTTQTATAGGAPTTVAADAAPITGSPAPDFTLKNIHGKEVTLSKFKGQPVLINFWATWCGPCRIEMPAMEAAYQEYKGGGFVVLAVDADEPLKDVTEFVNDLGLTFEILMDPGFTVNDRYQIRAYPTSFFVGRDGTIVSLQIGSMTESQLEENLAKILAK